MASKNFTDEVVKQSYAVWEVMQREAKNRGFALTRDHREYGEGRVIIGTIGAFIKGLGKEREWNLDTNRVDLIRRYLKTSGNVVTLSKVDNYKYRIYIREEWSNATVLKSTNEPDSIARRASKLTPEEAGEDREPAPVTYSCECGAGPFDNQMALNGHKASHTPRSKNGKKKGGPKPLRNRVNNDLNVRQSRLLMALAAYGGDIREKTGTSPVWADLAGETRVYVSTAMKRLVETGYVEVERSSPKAKNTKRVTMTPKAWKLVNEIGQEWRAKKLEPESPQPEVPQQAKVTQGFKLSELDDALLLDEIERRIKTADDKCERTLDEIVGIINRVNKGKISPLAALGEIERLL